MVSDIILIGPIRAGKTTQGRLLAQKLSLSQISLDILCWDYYQEIGYDEQVQSGPDGMIAWRFNVHAVERLLADYTQCVFDLGAGHSVYREEEALSRMQNLLAPYLNVFLILPCPDLEEASKVLQERNKENAWLTGFREQHGYDPNEHFLRHFSNFALAKHIVYTNGKSPEETRDEILRARRIV